MRPLEVVLLASELIGLTALATHRGALSLAWVPAVGAATQAWVEGPRWQLAPAWVLAAALSAGWATRRRPGAVLLTLGFAGLAVAIALPLALPVFRFPPPTGPSGVGTTTRHWVDAARPETTTTDPDDRRELMVQLWYPARTDPAAPRTPYLADPSVLAPLARLLGFPAFVFGHLKHVTTNAVEDVPVASGGRFPVLIFSPGRGGYRQHDTRLVEARVSHGYVVAGIDHPYAVSGVVFPDGRRVAMDPRMRDASFVHQSVPNLAADLRFALDQLLVLDQAGGDLFTGRLDLERVGAFGVSLGGAVAAEACRSDARFGACLAMDVWMPADVVRDGLDQPAMWMTRDADSMRLEGWAEADIEETLSTLRATYDGTPGAAYYLEIPGLFHADFSDAALLSPLTGALGITGTMAPDRAQQIVAAYALAFFDRHLKEEPAPMLDGPDPRFPEVYLGSR